MADFVSSIRATLTELIGRDESPQPRLPDGLPPAVAAVAQESVALLLDYQGRRYAQLYCNRLRRFIRKRGVDDEMFCAIARLMAARMSYHDAIRIAQLKLVEPRQPGRPPVVDTRRFRVDELVSALPQIAGEPAMWALECIGLPHRTVTIRFSTATAWSVRRLKFESSLRRWRLLSVRYESERLWVERWLHMIDRALTKRPDAAMAIIETASMIEGYGTGYRHSLSAWHQIIDGLAKPVFDGTLQLPDLSAAIAEARAAPHDPRGDQLRGVIAGIRARSVPGAP